MTILQIISMAAQAVLPIIILIAIGYCLRRVGFFSKEFVKTGNKLVFRLCLPCMLFCNVYEIEGFSAIRWDIVVYSLVVVCVIFFLGLITAVVTTKDNKKRGVIWQCTFRSNFAIIGLSLAGALGGSEAEGVAAVIAAFSIPLFNVLAVIALSLFTEKSENSSGGIKSIILNIIRNPLIIAVALGLFCLVIRTWQIQQYGEVVFALNKQTKFVYKVISDLKAIASPFALLVLGGQFEFSAVKGMRKEILVGTIWRIVLAPVLGIGGAILLSKYTGLLSCSVNEYPALVALFGSPVAVSSAVMAGAMGNDEQLATQLVVWTSLCSIITIFLLACVLMAMGLL